MDKRDTKLLAGFVKAVEENAASSEVWFVRRTAMRLWNLLDNRVPENKKSKALMRKIHGQALQQVIRPADEKGREELLLSLKELTCRCNDRRASLPFVVRSITEAIRPVGP